MSVHRLRRRTPGCRAALLALAAAVLVAAACGDQAASPPPNVVLIVADTARADAVSAYGAAGTSTPHVDALAAQGVLYRNARSTSAWTLPAHGSLFSGLYPSRHGAHHEHQFLAARHPTLPELLAPAYATAGFSENPNIGHAKGFGRGFEHFEETWRTRPRAAGGPAPPTIERALAWLAEREGARPFFLFLNLLDPHLPYAPPADLMATHLGDRTSAPEVERLRRFSQAQARRFNTGVLDLGADELALLRDLYRAEVASTDRRIGRLLDALAEAGVRDDTFVVVVGDHGENLGEHALLGHQLVLYETLLRVPLVLELRGVFDGGRVVEAPVQLVDLAPTILEVARVPPERWPPMEGQSLVAGPPDPERPSFAEYMRPDHRRGAYLRANPEFPFAEHSRRIKSIQVGRYKLIVPEEGAVELYDLEDDPGETRNLADERPALVESLAAQLEAWATGASPSEEAAPGLDPETREALEALGYL